MDDRDDVNGEATSGVPRPAPSFNSSGARPLGPRPLPNLDHLDGIGIQPVRLKKPRKPFGRRILGWLFKGVLAFVVASVAMVTLYRFVPPPFTLTMAGDIFTGHGVTKKWVPLSRIDADLARAAIAAEDSSFCTHSGFDYDSIAAAMLRNARGGQVLRGGSTISQQTAKNVFLWQGGGYFRKALEAWFTILIETIWTKRRIMEVYLNVAETGIGTYGVEAGARRYFKKGAGNLTPAEAARIAAMLPLPKKRAGVAPQGFTRRYGNSIAARIGVVQRERLDACLR